MYSALYRLPKDILGDETIYEASCEDFAVALAEQLERQSNSPNDDIAIPCKILAHNLKSIQVSEDNENGAIITFE